MRRCVCLQLGLDTDGLASGVNVGGGERGGGEVAVLAAHGVGGGSAGDEEAGEDSDGLGDGRHFDVVVVSVFVELVLILDVVVRFVDVLLRVCRGRRQEWRSQKQGGVT